MPDYVTFDAVCYQAYIEGHVSPEDFAKAMQAILIEKGGYVIDVGSTGQVLAEILLRLKPKVHSKKYFWKKFMVG